MLRNKKWQLLNRYKLIVGGGGDQVNVMRRRPPPPPLHTPGDECSVPNRGKL